jgi:hypothetical protein
VQYVEFKATYFGGLFFNPASRRSNASSIACRIKALRFPLPRMTASIRLPVPFGNRIIVISNPSGGRPIRLGIATASIFFHSYRITTIDNPVDRVFDWIVYNAYKCKRREVQ